MNDKRKWILMIAIGGVLAVAFGALIFLQNKKIEDLRADSDSLEQQIAAGRQLIAKTPGLEREVIIQRETDELIKETLPDAEEITDFVRTLREFEQQSGVRITDIKKKASNETKGKKQDFDKVVYSLKYDGDAFQLLAFLDLVEGHARFMSVPRFRMQTESRRAGQKMDINVMPAHQVDMDVETYVYEPKTGAQPVKIEGYVRKRDLLLSEIARRRGELVIASYEYRGPRGRRDPWVDPRVPVTDNPVALSIEQQIALVDELVGRVAEAYGLWGEMQSAEGLIEEMKARQALENELAALDDEVQRVETEGQLSFVPSERRFQNEVVVSLEELRQTLIAAEDTYGITPEELEAVAGSMQGHLRAGDFESALADFSSIEARVEHAERFQDERAPLLTELRRWHNAAQAFSEFSLIQIEIKGLLHHEGMSPVALVNGVSVSEGELLDSGVLVQTIGKNEIEFLYRGVIFSKPLRP